MDSTCIFCKIIAGEIPAAIVDREDGAIAINDVSPQAPTHLLVIPTEHHANLNAFASDSSATSLAKLFAFAARIGASVGKDAGYRIVINTGAEGGQTVDHLHLHVLAGRPMTWPPG